MGRKKLQMRNSRMFEVLTPGINPQLINARQSDYSIKAFYATMRHFREIGKNVIDIGSTVEVDDCQIPELKNIIEESHVASVEKGFYHQYASSYGCKELRFAITKFLKKTGGVEVNPYTEIMVTRGINDSFDRVLGSLDISHVIIPTWAPYIARSHTLLHGYGVVDVPLDMDSGNLDLEVLSRNLIAAGVKKGKTLLYITHPSSPLGTIMDDDFISNELIPYLKSNGIWLFSDSYVKSTRFDDGPPIKSILSYPGARDIGVEAITVSKEIGLPGARAGGLAGNKDIINGVRLLAATQIDIVPESSQVLSAKAFEHVNIAIIGEKMKAELKEEILPRLNKMNWPYVMPKAGVDMVINVPPNFIRPEIENPSFVAAFSILRRFGVAFCPCSVYGPQGKNMLRIVLKQKSGKIPSALDTLINGNFDWITDSPNEEDLLYIENTLSKLDLTKL